ncbi:MAG: hypothetical protein QNJ09_07130 [Paracoccaceae bacterium]|nr:hypothetical protein [Paracoccaceae bacterium]
MDLQRYELEVRLTTPFLFPSEEFGLFGYDKITLRDENGRPIIPRDQIRGVVRHGLSKLSAAGNDDAKRLLLAFGSGGLDATPLRNAEPGVSTDLTGTGRSRISFSDLVADREGQDHLPPIPRVHIDDESGAAKEGALASFEQVDLPCSEFVFVGEIQAYTDAPESIEAIIPLSLSVQAAIGSMKSVGFGRISEPATVKPKQKWASANPTNSEMVKWRFTLDRPYLVNAERVAENLYRGQVDIPGGALKGLLARHLSLTGSMTDSLSDALSDVRISFARPEGAQVAMPVSIVFDRRNKKLVDLAFSETGTGPFVRQADWKDKDADLQDAKKRYDAAERPEPGFHPTFETRVHTAIHESRGAVEDAMLYSTQAVKVQNKAFRASLDLSKLDEANRSEILKAISHPMMGLGRTDATVLPSDQAETKWLGPKLQVGRLALKLETPAFLVDHEDGKDAFTAYQAFWRSRFPQSPLIEFYTEERLAGGYWARRFGKPDLYRPFLLTNPGSVFVFDFAQENHDALQDVLRWGVCRDSWDGVEMNWRNCPFVAMNGYGAVSLYAPYSEAEK